MASRWGRVVPAVRNSVNNNADAAQRSSSALRPFRDANGRTNPFNFITNELRNMEREMSRMQQTMFNDHNRSSFFRPFSSFFGNNFSLSGGGQRDGAESASGEQQIGNDISDYIVEDKDTGKKKLQLEFDAHGFKPEDIEISTRSGNRLEIHAKYEDKSEGHRVYQEYTKVLTLPEGVDAKQIQCNFDNDSLTIEAPYTPPTVLQNDQSKQQIEPPKSGPRKIDVKHLGDSSHDDDVEGGSQPMVGGDHTGNSRWGTSSSSSATSSTATGDSVGKQQQQQTGADTTHSQEKQQQQQQHGGSEKTAVRGAGGRR